MHSTKRASTPNDRSTSREQTRAVQASRQEGPDMSAIHLTTYHQDGRRTDVITADRWYVRQVGPPALQLLDYLGHLAELPKPRRVDVAIHGDLNATIGQDGLDLIRTALKAPEALRVMTYHHHAEKRPTARYNVPKSRFRHDHQSHELRQLRLPLTGDQR